MKEVILLVVIQKCLCSWKSSVVLPIYKGKGDPMECGSYRGIKLLEHAMKVVERIFEERIRQQIDIDGNICEKISLENHKISNLPILWLGDSF